MAIATAVQRSAPHTRSFGASGTQISRGLIESRDANADVRGDLWYGDINRTGIAEKMMADAMVRQSVEAIVSPLLGATWAFRPAVRESAIDAEIADHCAEGFLERIPFHAVLERQLTGMVRDGFELEEWTEQVDALPEGRFPSHPGRGRGVYLEAPHHRPAWSLYEWMQSARRADQIDGITQWVLGSDIEMPGQVDISLAAGALLMRSTWGQEGANFAGFAPLRSAYGPWKSKMLLLIVDAIRHEREGAGIPTAEQPEEPTKEELEKANEILQDLRVNERGYINAPFGWKFSFTTTTGQSTGLNEAIERANRDIMFNMGCAFLLLGTGGRSGSNALGDVLERHYSIALDKYARTTERVWNIGMDGFAPVRRFVRANWGAKFGVPRLCARNLPTKDWSKVLPVIHNLALSKWLTPDDDSEAWARDVLTMPERDPETARELKAPAAGSQQMPNEQAHPPEPDQATSDALDELRRAYSAQAEAVDERMSRIEARVADFLAASDRAARAQLPRAKEQHA